MSNSSLKIGELIGNLATLGSKGKSRADVSRVLFATETPHSMLGKVLEGMNIKASIEELPNMDTLLKENAKWSSEAERLLGKKLPKVGMSYYFLANVQALWIIHEFEGMKLSISAKRAAHLVLDLPLKFLAASMGTTVDNLPLKLAREGEYASALRTARIIKENRDEKLGIEVADLAISALELVVPCFFGVLVFLEELVTPTQVFGNAETLALWSKKDGATLEDLKEARRLAEQFYVKSAGNQRIDRYLGK